MGLENAKIGAVPQDRRWYRMGGFSALLLATGYVAIIPLYAHAGVPPNAGGGDAWFRYLQGKTTVWWTILGISVFTDFLFVPLALALYLALKQFNKNLMVLASAFVGLFVVLDLAITWSHYASILTLYRDYTAAVDEPHRMAYIAAANYASAILTSRLEVVYAIVTLSSGIFLTGLVMLRATFHKITPYLGLATGVLGILSLTRSNLAIIANALFATAWLFFVGYGLHRLSQE